MNCSPRKSRDEPEINLIPFIDVLLVILIFLMLTTTYSKFTELQLTLPVADATAPHQAVITVMEAARRVGLSHITFATQSSASAGAGKP